MGLERLLDDLATNPILAYVALYDPTLTVVAQTPSAVKLLRVLQAREIERLGSQAPIRVDIRLLAATNQDLARAVRERREDIPLLIEYFLKKFAMRLDKPVNAVSREAMDVLLKYDHPGNVRELENILERAIILARHEAIYGEDLPLHLRPPACEEGEAAGRRQTSLPEVLHAIERRMLLRALERHGGVQSQAGAELGIIERVLRYKLQKQGLRAWLRDEGGTSDVADQQASPAVRRPSSERAGERAGPGLESRQGGHPCISASADPGART